jgi:hypothetical protein
LYYVLRKGEVKMKQFCVTTSMAKRLIGKALASHPEIKKVISKGTLVIVAGSTNGYVAEEILNSLGKAEDFTRVGFRRGVTVAPGEKLPKTDFPGDVVIVDGEWKKGMTIFDCCDDLKAGDIILKGANGFDRKNQAALQIGHPTGGTIMAALSAFLGRRVRLIIPVGLEKRVIEDVYSLAKRCNLSDSSGPTLFPIPGEIFTELDSIKLLTGADAFLIAAGGIHGAEGAGWLGISGTEEQIHAASELIKSVSAELPCRI